ncbi:flagellar motor switch protein FliM [Cryptosporangium sp. NPDC051539]|uniref:flagellar motor switch protein FliM n=1 Tax=Cryptosporangium sp. NPDC051539 TaxID=3363962 RepID=UPI0037A63F77
MSSSSAPAGASRSAGRLSRRSKGAGPQPYDFRRPTKLSREHARTLQMTYETFARQYTTLLTSSLRAISQVSLVSIEQLSYDEYIAQIGNPTLLTMVTLDPLPGITLFELPLDMALACIDHLLGGPGGPQPQRQLSEIETVLFRGMLDRVLGEFRYSFDAVKKIEPKAGAIEYNPQFAQAAAPSDPMVVVSLEVKVGSQECIATMCLPFAAVMLALQKVDEALALTPAERAAKETALRNVTGGLLGAKLPVVVRFGVTQMYPEQIVALEPGDVVSLGHPVNRPLTVSTNGITLAHAVPGNHGARLACLVVDPPREDARR